jgi:hypothetical protein
MLDVDTQDLVELARSEDQHPVKTLRSRGADEALGVCVRLRRPIRRQDWSDALAAKDLVEASDEL